MRIRLVIALQSILSAIILTTSTAQATPPSGMGYQYGDQHYRESLAFYPSQSRCGSVPLMIYIHGGGWLVGDDTDVSDYLSLLINRGFAVASLNYRLSYDAIFPAQIFDCKGAVRWLRAHAAQLNIDPNRFVVFGDSAGAHLASLLGTSVGVESLEGDVGGNLNFSSAVQYVAEFSGPIDMFAFGTVYNQPDSIVSKLFGHWFQDIINHMNDPAYADLVDLVHSAEPIQHVTAGNPPFRIIHGDSDTTVDPQHANWLRDALSQAGVPADLQLIRGGTHDLPLSVYLPVFDALAQIMNARKPADITCNGQVNIDDLFSVIDAWGPCPPPSSPPFPPSSTQPCPADITGDGVVNIDDLFEVINQWG